MEVGAVVGLGNPGSQYAETRHNLGFHVVDQLARRWGVTEWQHRFASLVARRGGARPLWLVKPQTFMNLSGSAVALLCRGTSLEPGQVLVVADDVDLPLGSLRLRRRGGAGAHNGLRSVVESIGEDFPRLRLGVRGESPWRDLAEYVLSPFETGELETVRAMVERACQCLEAVLHEGLLRAANRCNAVAPPKPPAGGA